MQPTRAFCLSILSILIGFILVESPQLILSSAEHSVSQSAFDKREAAYRANNIGVALLEQYKAKEAVDSFQQALKIKPDLLLARINLAIALYYLPDVESAKREAEKALIQKQDAPQAHYILGLIARAENRFDEAIAEFQRVLQTDKDDVGTNVNVGQIFVQQRKHTEAIAAFRRAVASEPYNETALYNLGLILTRTGKREEGTQLLRRFQQVKESGAGASIGPNYLEGGHYAAAVVSTGAEVDLINRATPNVVFADATQQMLPADARPQTSFRPRSGFLADVMEGQARAQAIVLFDYDGDGDFDIFDSSASQRLLRNDGRKFTDVTAASGLTVLESQRCFSAVAGDYDNDGKPDLFVARFGPKRFLLYHNDGNGRFSDHTQRSGIEQPNTEGSPFQSAAFVDVDHDGDLDIFSVGMVNALFRNNGDQTFIDITEQARVAAPNSFSSSSAVIPTDFDNRRDIDLLTLPSASPPKLFRNMRDGTFRDVAGEVGLHRHGAFWCAAAGDVNKDTFTDFFMSIDTRAVFALSDGYGRFNLRPAPRGATQAMAAQFLDYDNDGLLDLLAVTTRGVRLWRNAGQSFVDVAVNALPLPFRSLDATYGRPGMMMTSHTALASGDLDGDGDVDVIMRGPGGGLRILRNDGGNRNASVKVDLRGRVSNRSALQAKVEMRAGSLYQKLETYSASPAPAPADLIFGLGKRERPDAIRVIWPAGIVQAETQLPLASGRNSTIAITELDRKPSSCPYLYSWNGERFEFVTDFMGGGEMGHLEAPGHYNYPDPDEYVRIRSDQLQPKDGRYELRVTNELEEALFVDRLQLLAVAHPIGTEIYPNEGLTSAPKPFKLFVTKNARPPMSAVDDHGHDVLDLVSRLDRRWPGDFKLDRVRGYAEEHSLELHLPEKSKALLLTGWTDYAWSSDNVAAAQAGKAMKPPALQVKDRAGRWQTVIEEIGIPVGRPQTVTVDLSGKFASDKREVRIVTNMRIYWDQVLVAESSPDAPVETVWLNPGSADLRWRGYSAEVTPDGREPFGYDYARVSFFSPWKVMTGRYTREGDVRELLLQSDDMFAVCRTGDEIRLSFDATQLPRLPNGWTRTFLLYSDGFSKEMDINSASPDQVGPLPFHGMSRYPYEWPERYPFDARRIAYTEKYNTRHVSSAVSLLDAVIGR